MSNAQLLSRTKPLASGTTQETTSEVFDRVYRTTVNTTGTFGAGYVNILYE